MSFGKIRKEKRKKEEKKKERKFRTQPGSFVSLSSMAAFAAGELNLGQDREHIANWECVRYSMFGP